MSSAALRRLGFAAGVLAVAVVLTIIAVRIPRTLSIFLIAAFIGFGVSPIVRRLDRVMPRGAAIATVYALLLGGVVVLALVIVPVTLAQVGSLVAHTPDYMLASQLAVGRIEDFLRARLGTHVPLPTVGDLENRVGTSVELALSGSLASIGGIVINVFNSLLVAVSALILSVFFLLRGRDVRSVILGFVPPSRREKAAELTLEIASIFGHFVAGQVALCVIVGVAVWIALAPAHFAFALLIAVVCGLGYAVPFVGMLVAQVIAALLALPQGTGMVIWVSVAIFLIARFADNVLVPKIMSDQVGVSPIGVMFAVFAGGELFGLPGFVLGIPAAAVLKVCFKYFVQPWIVRMQLADIGLPIVETTTTTTTTDVVVTLGTLP